jgi:hypothetical protein
MAGAAFVSVSFPEAMNELRLAEHFGERAFEQYCQSADGVRHVRHYRGDSTIEGDVDLDELFHDDGVAGIVVDGDLTIAGSLLNWEIDTTASFVAIRGSLFCANIVAGCADTVIRVDARVCNVIVSTYNHGRLEIGGDAYAKYVIVDEHHTYVGRDVQGYGWQCAGHGDVDLPDSDWIDEIRSEFRAEFFKEDGRSKCPSGNVDLVKALLAGRDISQAIAGAYPGKADTGSPKRICAHA